MIRALTMLVGLLAVSQAGLLWVVAQQHRQIEALWGYVEVTQRWDREELAFLRCRVVAGEELRDLLVAARRAGRRAPLVLQEIDE